MALCSSAASSSSVVFFSTDRVREGFYPMNQPGKEDGTAWPLPDFFSLLPLWHEEQNPCLGPGLARYVFGPLPSGHSSPWPQGLVLLTRQRRNLLLQTKVKLTHGQMSAGETPIFSLLWPFSQSVPSCSGGTQNA